MNEEEEKANCFAFERDENGFPLKGKPEGMVEVSATHKKVPDP